tara:strand:- start:46 stop:453 length:408 start_codon:yes stop_codon:yes gene_type:complete
MRFLKILLFFIIYISLVFPHHHKKRQHYGKSWNYKKKHNYSNIWKHKKKHHHNKNNYRPKFKLTLRYNYPWSYWKWYHPKRDIIVIKEEGDSKKNEDDNFEDIIAQIEKLSELKEKDIISEKEFEKKKKELLKRI